MTNSKRFWILTILGLLGACSPGQGSRGTAETNDSETDTKAHGTSSTESLSDSVDSSSSLDTETQTTSCTQPLVQANCTDHWCRIPHGCFEYGSIPGVDFCKKLEYSNDPFEVTLTRDFEILQHEVTQAEWTLAGFPHASFEPHCDNCPVGGVSWFEALAYCNVLSAKAGLDSCYDLSCCEGRVGVPCVTTTGGCISEFHCPCVVEKYASPYVCPGFRLPTSVEWEYAARAGTTTQTYNGDFNPQTAESYTDIDPVMDEIAWYAPNNEGSLVPRAIEQKKPNALGLYDMVGNVFEWCSDKGRNKPLDFTSGQNPPIVDPYTVVESEKRTLRGGYLGFSACEARTAHPLDFYPDEKELVFGLRPVRTLFHQR